MTRQKYTISRRRHPRQFIEPTTTITCPRWLQRRMYRNLQHAAHCRVDQDRARWARQILDHIEAEKVATRRRPHIGQPAAIVLPSASPAAAERQGRPDKIRCRRPVRATVERGLHKAAKWLTKVCLHGRGQS